MNTNEPKENDFVQLLDTEGNPSENHTSVSKLLGTLGEQLFLIEDNLGETLAVCRLPEFDTNSRKAFQEVITAVA